MSALKNPRHERFAQLVASGIAANAAFTQVGYKAPQNSPRLRNNELVAKRIAELQTRNERKAEMAALTRDELVRLLTEIVYAARSRLSEARPADGLKAAEMLAKMCGWNEPERVNVQSVEVKVDAALIAQLRAGYAEAAHRKLANAQLDRVEVMDEACAKEKHALFPASDTPGTPTPRSTPLAAIQQSTPRARLDRSND